MRAAFYERNGTAKDVLHVGDMPEQTPGPGEVRVRLAVSGVNPSDVKARGGTRKITVPRIIPHSDGAGEIDAVGKGVSQDRIGERVWVWNGQWKRPFGTCAQSIVVPEALAVTLPDSTSFEQGACLGIPAMTASHAVSSAEARPGMAVLVAGGAGAVGHYAIQFAKAHGATVLTTVSSDEKAELARAAGADHVINYKREGVGERVKAFTNGKGVDAVVELDFAVNAPLVPDVMAPRGILVIYGNSRPVAEVPTMFCLTNQITLKSIFVYELTTAERARALAEIQGMLEGGKLIHTVAKTFDLDDVAAAHEMVESGRALGNVMVRL